MIVNASPLIIFGKLNKLELLKKILKKVIISYAVYEEVVKNGIEINASEAFLIEEYINRGEIEVKKLDETWKKKSIFFQKAYSQIDYGEAETIALALQEKEVSVLIDERDARKAAELHGLIPLGSLWVLLAAFKKEFISENELRQIINKMTTSKFRIGADVMNDFWNELMNLKKEKSKK